MSNPYEEFMLQNTLESNEKIKKLIITQEDVRIYFNKFNNNEVFPAVATVKITGLVPFEYIETTGGRIYFVSRDHLIKRITTKSGENVYDKTLVASDNTRIGDNLSKARKRVLGVDQVPNKLRQEEHNIQRAQ